MLSPKAEGRGFDWFLASALLIGFLWVVARILQLRWQYQSLQLYAGWARLVDGEAADRNISQAMTEHKHISIQCTICPEYSSQHLCVVNADRAFPDVLTYVLGTVFLWIKDRVLDGTQDSLVHGCGPLQMLGYFTIFFYLLLVPIWWRKPVDPVGYLGRPNTSHMATSKAG